MKLNHILYEARAANKQKEAAKLVTKPRLQREGDFVWHLYKFFEPGKVETNSRKNPAHKKELTKIIADVINEFKKKFPKNTELQNIKTSKAAPKIATASWYSGNEDFTPWPYDPDDGYDDVGEWEREMEEERRWHEEQRGWNVNAHRGIGDDFQRHQGHGGHKPTTEKLLKAIADESKKRLGAMHDRLPQEETPSSSKVQYVPKKGIRVFANDKHVKWINTNIDAKGNLTAASFQYDNKQYPIKGIIKATPSELRELFKYYKSHDEW